MAVPAKAPEVKPAVPEKKDESHKNIFGFHPEVIYALVLGPLAVCAVICSVVFLDVGSKCWTYVAAQWNTTSVPISKALVKNKDNVVLGVAVAMFVPPALVVLVTIFRTIRDLHKSLALWQKALFYTIIVAALSTVITLKDTLYSVEQVKKQVQKHWDTISDPVEDLLTRRTDTIIAGAAICCLAPVGAALLTCIFRIIGIEIPEVLNALTPIWLKEDKNKGK